MDKRQRADHSHADREAAADADVQRGPIGTGAGYSGQEYDSNGHAADAALNTTTTPSKTDESDEPDEPDAGQPAIPPENGERASFDRATGEVRGSGVGAGGGNPGEDFASDSAAGDGFAFTGRADKR